MKHSRAFLAISVLGFLLFFCFCSKTSSEQVVKHPDVSGQFYPADKGALAAQIDSFFKEAAIDAALKEKDIAALIVPHAGYEYSGQVAAHAFKQLEGRRFDTVIVIAASHFHYFEGIAVYPNGAFRTPLGDIEVDEAMAKALAHAHEKIKAMPEVFEKEHPVEVELPFLQKSLENFKIVPLIIGEINYSDSTMLAKALLGATKGKNALIVASTDLSHFYPYPIAVEKDKKTISYINAIDPAGLWGAYLKKESEMCGFYPVASVLQFAKEAGLKAQFFQYANSGDVTGDKRSVVGYSSFVFFKERQPESGQGGENAMFNESQKKRLLAIARQTITQYVKDGTRPEFKEDDPALEVRRGLFVTLHKQGELRGCIGSFSSTLPVYKEVAKIAIESATQDPRFPAVRADEVDGLAIEISVLTEPQRIDDWRKIRLGIDGVIVRRGFAGGVFLPQVATETGWDLETFLAHLCAGKAGLSADAYKDPGTQLSVFQAIIFKEGE